MGLFQKVDGEAAIVVERGVYKQGDLYTRDGYLYAATKGGYVRLFEDGSTSVASCRLETLTWSGRLGRDPQGRLVDPDRLPTNVNPLPLRSGMQQRLLGLTQPEDTKP